MTLYISYSRKDELVAHLLSYILASRGLTVLIDRKLKAGDYIDKEVQASIDQAEVVLVL